MAEQTRPQKQVSFDPVNFDRFAGYYQRDPAMPSFFHIYRQSDRYYSQITGQIPVEIFPESPTEFFATVVAAQIALKSLKFSRVMPYGADVYLATFENGQLECTIAPLSQSGKIMGDFFLLLP